jgi:hypothetical protein
MFLFDFSNQIVVMADSKHGSNNKTSTNVTSNRKYPNLLTARSNSVSGERAFKRSETLPNPVSVPVWTTRT